MLRKISALLRGQQSCRRPVVLMDKLESRSLLSGSVVHVGPTEAIKSLDQVKWPGQNSTASLTVIVDYSSKPYVVGHHGFWGNVTIEPADVKHQPTLKLAQTNYPTFYSNYKLTIKNIKTSGGIKGILTGTNTKGSVDVENVTMTDGGAIWRGQGCVNATFRNNDVLGPAYDYTYSNFSAQARNVLIDNSGTSKPVIQGNRQAAIRFMDTDNLVMKNVVTKARMVNGRVFKQDIQLRPSSKSMTLINCKFYIADVGDMTWRKPAQKLQSVTFTNCTMNMMPHITSGVGTVKLSNCLVGGKRVSKTL